MAIKQRQIFLLRLLTDDKLRNKFYSGKKYDFGLTKQDSLLIRAIDKDGIIRKSASLKRIMTKKTLNEGSD